MSYVPRRRLVLASTRSQGIHVAWAVSQMPWDDEETTYDETDQGVYVSSQVACLTQEAALTAVNPMERGLQPDVDCQTGFTENRVAEQTHDRLANKSPCDSPVQDWRFRQHVSSVQHAMSQADPTDLSLPWNEYSDMYNFLTKGTGHVQEVSVKERALYKLAILRQVSIDLPTHPVPTINKTWLRGTRPLHSTGDEVTWDDARKQNQAGDMISKQYVDMLQLTCFAIEPQQQLLSTASY